MVVIALSRYGSLKKLEKLRAIKPRRLQDVKIKPTVKDFALA